MAKSKRGSQASTRRLRVGFARRAAPRVRLCRKLRIRPSSDFKDTMDSLIKRAAIECQIVSSCLNSGDNRIGCPFVCRLVGKRGVDSQKNLPISEISRVNKLIGKAAATEKPDPAAWLDEYGDALFRFAYVRVGDRTTAEDLVQETFLAALQGGDRYAGEARVSTWLFAILRNKISDHFRAKGADVTSATEAVERSGSAGKGRGSRWDEDPARLVEEREFWLVFQKCAGKVPEKLSEAYYLRDMERLSPKEVCEILEISPTNLSMRLYRARRFMRDCLDKNWFS